MTLLLQWKSLHCEREVGFGTSHGSGSAQTCGNDGRECPGPLVNSAKNITFPPRSSHQAATSWNNKGMVVSFSSLRHKSTKREGKKPGERQQGREDEERENTQVAWLIIYITWGLAPFVCKKPSRFSLNLCPTLTKGLWQSLSSL